MPDDPTEPVPAINEPAQFEPIQPDELVTLRQGYERNQRRSRIGITLGALALIMLLGAAPGAIGLLVKQDQIQEVLDELRDQNQVSACRSQVAAAQDIAETELFVAAISVPRDPDRIIRAVETLNRIKELRGDMNPCQSAARLGDITTGGPTEAPPPPSTEPPTSTPATSSGTRSVTTTTPTSSGVVVGTAEAPAPASTLPREKKPGQHR